MIWAIYRKYEYIVLKTFDTIRALRDAGMAAGGGFLSPMEVEDNADLLKAGARPFEILLEQANSR